MGINPTSITKPFPAGHAPVAPSAARHAAPPLNLVDPITSKRLKLDSPFADKLLTLGPLDKLKLQMRQTFVTLPKTVIAGLKGDSSYTFTDFLHVATIPYYLGGAVLAASFAAGRDRRNFIRQGLGVGLYYLGIMAANSGINALYKLRTGVDLDMRYQKPNGDIERVFASADFPRFDLLHESHYQKMAHQMGIPENIADPEFEVQQQVRRVISDSRAAKLILGNLLAAVGAGFIARSDAWLRLLGGGKVIKAIWQDSQGGHVVNRIMDTGKASWGLIKRGVQEKITGYARESNPWLRRGVLGGVAAVTGLVLWHSWHSINRNRAYESPMVTRFSAKPNATSKSPATDSGIIRPQVFAAFESALASSSLKPGGSRP